MIRLENAMDLKVAGIIEDVPFNSDFPTSVIGSFETFKNSRYYSYTTDWGSTTSAFQVFMKDTGKPTGGKSGGPAEGAVE